MWEEVWKEVWEEVWEEVWKVWEEVWEEVWKEVWKEVWEEVWKVEFFVLPLLVSCWPSYMYVLLPLPPSLPPSSFLLDSSAFPAPVNNEGDTPEDLADDEAISELIRAAIQKRGEGRGQGEGEGGRGRERRGCVIIGQ